MSDDSYGFTFTTPHYLDTYFFMFELSAEHLEGGRYDVMKGMKT